MDPLVLRDRIAPRDQLLFDRLWVHDGADGATVWAASSASGSLVQLSLRETRPARREGETWLGSGDQSVFFGDMQITAHHLLVADRNTGGVSLLNWSDGGDPRRIGGLSDEDNRPLPLSQMALLNGGSTPLLVASAPAQDEGQDEVYDGDLRLYRLNETLDRATWLGSVNDTDKSTLSGVSQVLSVHLDGTDFILTTSSTEHGLTSHAVTGAGLELRDTLGPKDGLWVTGMEDIATLMVGGQQFILGVSAHSGTLSAVRINPMGALFITDIALDDLTTRFDGAVALDTFETHGRGFVVTGGTDGGIALFELLPGGRLWHHFSQSQDTGWNIGNLQDITATLIGSEVQIMAAGTRGGLAQMVLELTPMGELITGTSTGTSAPLTGTANDDILIGAAGDDTLRGGTGDDTLFAGTGQDVLYGGDGADVFVFQADSAPDRIYGFELGVDRIDLGDWGRIYDIDGLAIRGRTWGAAISWRDEMLYIHSHDQTRIEPGDWSINDFLF